MTKRYNVYVHGLNSRLEPLEHHQGSFVQLKDAREFALTFFTMTRDVQIFKEWDINLPFGWVLLRSKKLINWQTGETT